jgi:DNA-binding XRE family transcriptional regulator/predicted GIY-YIG superfamily endonuclease
MNYYVYKLTDTSGFKYYGVTKEYKRRIQTHLSGNGSISIRKALSFGEVFSSEIVFEGTEEECYKKEAEIIKLENTIFPNGYNLSPGGYQGGISSRTGSKNTQAILNESKVLSIRVDYAENNKTQEELAEEYGVVRETISAIVRGKSWKEVGGPLIVKKYQDRKTPQNIIDNIIELRKNTKLTYDQIAKKLNISRSVAAKYGSGAR